MRASEDRVNRRIDEVKEEMRELKEEMKEQMRESKEEMKGIRGLLIRALHLSPEVKP